MIKVVAALIEKDHRFLIARRSTGDSSALGKWEFPGGKVNDNEDEFHAIEREIKEEFEIDVQAIKFLTNNIHESSNMIDLRLYQCKYISGKFNPHDHSEFKFVTRDELLNYDLAPADILLAQYVKEVMK